MSVSRRKFLTLAGVSAASVTMVSPLEALYARVANGQVANGIGYGPLSPKLPENAAAISVITLGELQFGATLKPLATRIAAQLEQLIRTDYARALKVVKEANIKAE